MTEEISLKKVKDSDIKFLYELLLEREKQSQISHKKVPSWKEHVKFVKSKPYLHWYIISYGRKKVGSISLTLEHEIGIWIKKEMQQKGIGNQAMKLLIRKNPNLRYLANINPKNKDSIKFFKKNGFKLIQYTYEITDSKKNR